jgi:hypothetical protein
MAKLPTRDDMGAPPSARSGRPIATYDTSAVAKGQIALGRGISALGEAGMDIVKHQHAAEEYDAELKFQKFKWDEELGLDEAVQKVEPGQAGKFPEEWSGGYREKAKAFLSEIPESVRSKYDLKLYGVEKENYRKAATFARTEQKRTAGVALDEFRESYMPKSGDPQAVERFKGDYEHVIERSPWLTPIEKDELKRKGFRDIEQTHVATLLSDRTKARDVLRDLGYGPEDDAEKSTGLLEPGNIDLAKRPRVKNEDGSISTIQSMSVTIDGREVLIPTITDDGKVLSEDDAVKQYEKTGKHLGIFDNAQNATVFAKQLSAAQGQRINAGQPEQGASFDAASALISTRLETGKKNPLEGVSSIARDSAGTKSYGNFGLNSGGSAQKFVTEYGGTLGLEGEPGTPEFDRSWRAAAVRDPQALHQAEMAWYSGNIVANVGQRLKNAGVDETLAGDPRVQAYFADRSIQQGAGSIDEMRKHVSRIKAAADGAEGDPAKFLKNITEADREAISSDFPTALRTGVYSQRGHDNRLDGRLRLALGVGGETGEGARLPSPDTYSGPYRHLTADDRLRFATAARTALKQEAAEVAQDVRAFENIAEQGFAPKPGQMDTLRKRVESGADAETRQSFMQAEQIVTWQDTARKATPEELDIFVRSETERLRKGGATAFDAKRVAMADKLLTNMRTELKSDPLGWADRVGLVAVQPVDFSTPETAQASMGLRVKQAEAVAQRYGLEPKYLRDDEKQKLTAAIEAGGEQTLDTAAKIAASAGDHAPAILSEISKNSPTAAIIGGMVTETGMSAAARDAADGIALRKEAGFQTVAPSKKESRSAVTAELGASLSGMPQAETAVIDAANAIYEARARKQQLTEYDAGVWQQALREVVGERKVDGKTYGGVVDADPSWGGRKIIIPPFVAQDGWRDVIEATSLQDLWQAGLGVPSGGDGQAIAMNRVKGATLVQSGNGRYMLSLGNPDLPGEEKWIMRQDAPSEPYEIDLYRLRPILQQRRPELFLGAPPVSVPQPSSMTGFGE